MASVLSSLAQRVAQVGGTAAGSVEHALAPPGLDAQRFYSEVLEDLRREPTYALETIALAAVQVHGASAQAWLAEVAPLRYSPEQLAKLAVRRSTNLARVEGAAFGLGGFVTIAPDVAALVWILTRQVVFVAAAYGQDPTHRDRAAELLVITEIYDTVDEAKAGLDRQGERLAIALARRSAGAKLKGKKRSMSHRLIRYAGKRAAKRYGGRMVPGIGAVLGAIDNAAATKATGERAIAFYRSRPTA